MNPSLWAIAYAVFVGGSLAALTLGPLFFGLRVTMAAGWRWWNCLIAGVVCLFAPISMLAYYQAAETTWKTWAWRGVVVALLLLTAILIGDSSWLRSSVIARNSFLGLVSILQGGTADISGNIITTADGYQFEVNGRWSTAIFLGAYGACLGLMYLRYTLSATIGLAWSGLMIGGLLSANHFAWLANLMQSESLNLLHDYSYYGHFYLPVRAAPWIALLLLSQLRESNRRNDRAKTDQPKPEKA